MEFVQNKDIINKQNKMKKNFSTKARKFFHEFESLK